MTAVSQSHLGTPHALEAEMALLGAILVNNQGLRLVVGVVESEHFYEALHARVFEAMKRLVGAGQKADPVSLAPMFREDATMKELGGPAYLARLAASATTVVNAQEYARLIVDTWIKRKSLEELRGLEHELQSTHWTLGGSAEVVRSSLARLAAAADAPNQNRRQSIGAVGEEVLTAVNDAYVNQSSLNTGCAIGLHSLESVLHCWGRQDLVLVAARPSMGKTTFATSVLRRSAEKGQEHVLFFSLEMSSRQLGFRMLSDMAFVDSHKIAYEQVARGRVNSGDIEHLADAQQRLKLLPFTVDDRGGLTVEQIAATATLEKQRQESMGRRLGVVCIDHGLKIRSSDRYSGNRVNEIAEITNGLKNIAKTLDLTVVCLVQLNRGLEGRDNKRPTLADLRGSGSWEEDADAIMFLYREAYYLERHKEDDMSKEAARLDKLAACKNKLEVLIEKNRMGPCTTVEMFSAMPYGFVGDLEGRHG